MSLKSQSVNTLKLAATRSMLPLLGLLFVTGCSGGGGGSTAPDEMDSTDSGQGSTPTDSIDVNPTMACVGDDLPPTVSSLDLVFQQRYADLQDQLANNTPADYNAYPYAGVIEATGFAVTVSAVLAQCSYEMHQDNQCGLFSSVTNDVRNGDALSFDGELEDGTQVWQVSVNDPQYSSGEITFYESSVVTESGQWSRSADGTETLSAMTAGGNTMEFTEYSDCSGLANFVWLEDGITRSVVADWNSPEEVPFNFTYTFCSDDPNDSGCTTVTRVVSQ